MSMRVRILGVVVLLLSLFPVLLLPIYLENKYTLVKTDFDPNSLVKRSDDGPPMYNQKSIPIWDRENAFINNNLFYMQGRGPDIRTKEQKDNLVNSKAIKIALIGDSFTWGNGAYDSGMSIGRRLEEALNKAAGANTFNILIQARNGDSTYNYVDVYTKTKIKELNPDIIVYDFFQNDVVPSFNERMICGNKSFCTENSPETKPEYTDCIGAKNNDFSFLVKVLIRSKFPSLANDLIIRHCDPIYQKLKIQNFDVLYLMNNPDLNPWYPTWKKAVKLFAEQTSSVPTYVANLYSPSGISPKVQNILFPEFKANNLPMIPMTNSIKLITEHPVGDLTVNKTNGHAGSPLTQAYASDIANYILTKVTPTQIKNTEASKFSLIPNLVSSKMPANISLSQNTPTNVSFTLEKAVDDPKYPLAIAGEVVPAQHVLCADLMYSHIALNLNPDLKPGTKIKISIKDNPDHLNLKLILANYDNSYFLNYANLGDIGQEIIFTIPQNSKGSILLIGDSNINKNCSIKEIVDLPSFSGSLEILKN